ncbi:MAG: AI-2E family transporter [Myxococcales bacterium]|nr:AI-2E family transporter [Myxococcales bacterium]
MTTSLGPSGAPYPSLRWVTFALSGAALVCLSPLWASLTLACWVSSLARPLLRKIAKGKDSRGRAAAAITTGIVLAILVPVALVGISLALSAADLAREVLKSQDGSGALRTILSGSGVPKGSLTNLSTLSIENVSDFVKTHGSTLFAAFDFVAAAAVRIVVGTVVFVLGTYVFLLHGTAIYKWMCERVPLYSDDFSRFANAFTETGRGLIIGTGGTALLQGLVAGVGYAAVGIGNAAGLGFLTFIVAFIPSIGTPFVWGPVMIGLYMEGRMGAAVAILVVGLVVSVADNFVRPVLARHGSLKLPSFAVFLAMLGGLLLVGAWGILLGPLAMRLSTEALDIHRERRLTTDST